MALLQKPAIRLLGRTNNERGDLFTRLVQDLFFALGYDDLRLDVAKSGREIDLRGTHRFEPRDVIAECKAEKEPIGGTDANKFLGVLTRERDAGSGRQIHAYFVSLSGFRESAVEQERETTAANRLILLNGRQVVEELVRSRVLVPETEAVERAGRCIEAAGLDVALDSTELLGHPLGYIWAVYYGRGKQRTHVVLIHADGTPLAEPIAKEVIEATPKNDALRKPAYVGLRLTGSQGSVAAVLERYATWIGEECGYIHLDGLPADTDLSATRMKLERLFVPLKVTIGEEKKELASRAEQLPTMLLGECLAANPHLAIVAKPGGGKSTLLKRLAIAYAMPSRRGESEDALPDRDWLPLFLRCRDLRDRIQRPILELIDDLPRHAGMNEDEARLFHEHVHTSLRSGTAHLLVDGLDEIADEGARQTFCQHLRTFVGMFPNVALVVTSREAGFRLVAGVLAGVCTRVTLAPFDEDDVARLCERWHLEVVANTDKVRADAARLAETIWENERIRALAENPLMLTTLLVVRRSIGELPNRRVELYGEAVRVLIRTWNTEGFAPLDLNEALAQLSYVACAMMEARRQQIGQRELIRLLRRAREELVPELDFAQTSPEQFIERIEYRSSLLMQTGHARIDDEVQPVYEFRHLTFQEYLAARGFVEEQYPGRSDGRSLVEILEPHYSDVWWREVIPLAAVLAGRKADAFIERLTIVARQSDDADYMLWRCLHDEIQVRTSTLRSALGHVARDRYSGLGRGKFASVFAEVAEQGFLGGGHDWPRYVHAMEDSLADVDADRDPESVLCALEQALGSGERMLKVRAAFRFTFLVNRFSPHLGQIDFPERQRLAAKFERLRDGLGEWLLNRDLPLALAGVGALAATGSARLPNKPLRRDLLLALYRLWSQDLLPPAMWAFARQPLLARDAFADTDFPDAEHLFAAESACDAAHLVLGWYRRRPWGDDELLSEICARGLYLSTEPTFYEILRRLGPSGAEVSAKLRQVSPAAERAYQLLDS